MIMSSIFDQMPQGRVNLGSCLHIAAFKGHTEVVKLLLDNGADVNSKNHVSYIAIIVCVSDCVIAIMILDGNVVAISTIYTSTNTSVILSQNSLFNNCVQLNYFF